MRALCFGDEAGLEILKASIPRNSVCGIVTAEGRDNAIPVAQAWACELGVTHRIQPKNKKGEKYEAFISWLRKTAPDIGIVCSYSLIFGEDMIRLPRKGLFNVHGGLLPQYRGANVINWVLINGERQTGITIHRIVPKVDAGEIVSQKKMDISFIDTALTLRERMMEQTMNLLRESWSLLSEDPVTVYPQDELSARTCLRRKPEDGLVDWTKPAEEIYNLIRALVFPWPGAFYYDENGKKVVIDYFLPLENVKRLQSEQLGQHIEK